MAKPGRGLALVVLVDRDRAFRGDEPFSLSSSAAVNGSIEHARSITRSASCLLPAPYRGSTAQPEMLTKRARHGGRRTRVPTLS